MSSIQQHNGGYRAQVAIKGIRDSKSFRTKREAEAWAAARETEIRADTGKKPGERVTLGQVLARYRDEVSPTKRGARWEALRIDAFLRDARLPVDLPVARLNAEQLGAWRDSRVRQVAASTVKRELGLLSSVLTQARREWGMIGENPVLNIRKPRSPDHRRVVISRAQIRRMLVEMRYSSRAPVRSVTQAVAIVFLVALRTGMRAGELCGLTWDRVYDGYCSTPHKVGRLETSLRDVPLTPKAMRLIKRMRGFDNRLVFGISAQSLDAVFRKYRKRAGLSGFTFHDSRHTAATWIVARMKSNDLPAQQAILDLCNIFGWTRLDEALTYYNPSAADIARRIS